MAAALYAEYSTTPAFRSSRRPWCRQPRRAAAGWTAGVGSRCLVQTAGDASVIFDELREAGMRSPPSAAVARLREQERHVRELLPSGRSPRHSRGSRLLGREDAPARYDEGACSGPRALSTREASARSRRALSFRCLVDAGGKHPRSATAQADQETCGWGESLAGVRCEYRPIVPFPRWGERGPGVSQVRGFARGLGPSLSKSKEPGCRRSVRR